MLNQPLLGYNYSNMLYYYLAPPQARLGLAYMFQSQKSNRFFGHPVTPMRTDQQAITSSNNNPEDTLMFMELHAKKRNHDKNSCATCRQTMTYLLTPPNLMEAYELTFDQYSLFDQNLKLFDNPQVQKLIEISNVGFNFASMKRFSGFKFNSFDESSIIGGIDYSNAANDTASSCETSSEFDEIWIDHELSIDSPFKPKVNSTFDGKKLEDSTMNMTPWKQPVVFDPSLSPPYNDAFPSLDTNGGKKNQEKHIVRSGNGRYFRIEYPDYCVFCRNNAEPPEVFLSHVVKDPKTGKTTCPVLRKYRCIYCKAIGDNAHTRSYCPKKILSNMKRAAMAYQKQTLSQ